MNWLYFTIGIATLLGTLSIFLAWYLRQILTQYIFLGRNISNLKYNLQAFSSHLQEVYKMDRFYGEPILERLLQHSKETTKIIEEFYEVVGIEGDDNFEEWAWYEFGTDNKPEDETPETPETPKDLDAA